MRFWVAAYSRNMASVNLHLGKYEQAKEQCQLGLSLAHEVGGRRGIAVALSRLGWLALTEEKYTEAHQLLQEMKSLFLAIRRFSIKKKMTGWLFLSME